MTYRARHSVATVDAPPTTEVLEAARRAASKTAAERGRLEQLRAMVDRLRARVAHP